MNEHPKDAEQVHDLPQAPSERQAADEKAADVKGGTIVAVNGGGNTPNGEAATRDETLNVVMREWTRG